MSNGLTGSAAGSFPASAASPLFEGDRIVCRPLPCIDNGPDQRIFWLGVNGYVIVNQPAREMLLVDPWPSYRKSIGRITHPKAIRRLQSCINFIRQGKSERYMVKATLVSHSHFDHVRDIPYIYKYIQGKTGKRDQFKITGSAYSKNELPPIFCDRDTRNYLKARFLKLGSLKGLVTKPDQHGNKWHTVTITKPKNLGHPRYDDTYNLLSTAPLKAGLEGETEKFGSFTITPYTWDHLTVIGKNSEIPGEASGNLQRISAFLISTGPGTKRTFIVGSSGEMSYKYTEALQPCDIETDLLIQAMSPSDNEHFKHMMKYNHDHVTVHDRIVCSHFERFMLGNPATVKSLASHDFKKVKIFINDLPEEDRKKTVVLGRACFEYNPPPRGPSDLFA